MAAKKEEFKTNLLLSSENELFSVKSPSAILVPVQGSDSSAVMTSEVISENNSSVQESATFSLFSGDSGYTDPFLTITNTDQSSERISDQQIEDEIFKPSQVSGSAVFDRANVMDKGNVLATYPPFQPHVQHAAKNPYASQPVSGSPGVGRPKYAVPDYANFSQSRSSSAAVPQSVSNSTPLTVEGDAHTSSTLSMQTSSSHSQTFPINKQGTENMYHSVMPHWCYKSQQSENIWFPFSVYDSARLEQTLRGNLDIEPVISTDGGRYDVNVVLRERSSVYWDEPSVQVKRCTWFEKSETQHRYVPIHEELADHLESVYKSVVMENAWHKQIDLDKGEMIVIHNPQVIVHLIPVDSDSEVEMQEFQMKSRLVKRGIAETDLVKEIPEDEIGVPDHVVLVCHGIGPVCDLRSRSIVECVDELRTIQLSLLKSHFKTAITNNQANRIEFLPIHWHHALHGDATGVDEGIQRLTLPSIQRLRDFTNETLLDILFYSSPVYCQTIAETIGSEVNSLYNLFLSRNPTFCGRISVAGHSLGSLMLFDILCNQGSRFSQMKNAIPQNASNIPKQCSGISNVETSILSDKEALHLDKLLESLNLSNFSDRFKAEQIDMETLTQCTEADLKDIGLPMGPRKKLIGYLKKQQEEKDKVHQQELRVDTGQSENFLTKDESDFASMGEQPESISGCLSNAINVHVDFQQFDMGTGQPMVKYPELQFNPLICFALGSPIGMFLTVRGISELGDDFCLPTCDKFFNIFHPYDPVAYRIEPLVNNEFTFKPLQIPHYKGRKRLHLEIRESLGRMGLELKQGIISSVKRAIGSVTKFAQLHLQTEHIDQEDEHVEKVLEEMRDKQVEVEDSSSVACESVQLDVSIGRINQGERVDYVLQERPLESFNDYLFAFQSHFCYWNSEDTVLFMMKEIFRSMEVMSDSAIKKQSNAQVSTATE